MMIILNMKKMMMTRRSRSRSRIVDDGSDVQWVVGCQGGMVWRPLLHRILKSHRSGPLVLSSCGSNGKGNQGNLGWPLAKPSGPSRWLGHVFGGSEASSLQELGRH